MILRQLFVAIIISLPNNTAVLGVRLRGKDSKSLGSTFVSNDYIIRIIEFDGWCCLCWRKLG